MSHLSFQYAHRFMEFLQDSPSVFHVIESQSRRLLAAGYEKLSEGENWSLTPGGKYFVTRNSSAILAFRLPQGAPEGFMVAASHSDSPVLKVKAGPDISGNGYRQLNVEVYGGALLAPWFDRPLWAAGRVFVRRGDTLEQRLVALPDLAMIPSLAIHMDREANKGKEIKPQKDLLPLYGMAGDDDLLTLLSRAAGVEREDVCAHDIYLCNHQAPTLWGAAREFLSAPRLDDLECAFASLTGFLESEGDTRPGVIPVHVVFDNEEVGSSTRQGAAAGFLRDTLTRVGEALGLSRGELLRLLAQSFLLSADNAHAAHPNYTEKADPVNRPKLGQGVVLKFSGNQKYTTDAASAAVTLALAGKAGVTLQTFTNHADLPGGSTLGNLSVRQLGVKTADIGLAQLAMHSPYETGGAKDLDDLVALTRALFSSRLREEADGSLRLM